MGINQSMKVLQFMKKLLAGDRDDLTPVPFIPKKPTFHKRDEVHPLPRKLPTEVGMSNKQIKDFVEIMASTEDMNIHSIMIAKKGYVIAETAFAPFSLESWHITHSLAKTFVGLATGFAIEEGLFQLDTKVISFFSDKTPLLPNGQMKQVTIEHLLSMRSGINFREINTVLSNDWLNDLMRTDFKFTPGSKFDYNSLNSYLLAETIARASGKTVMQYLKPRVFEKLGMTNISWENGPTTTEKGGWGMYVGIEELCKFGQLFVQQGQWEIRGKMEQIIAADWIKEMQTTHATSDRENENYGFQMWIDKKKKYTLMSGLFGQLVFIDPKNELVVCVFAGNRNILNNGNAVRFIQEYLVNGDTHDATVSVETLQHVLSSQTYQQADLARKVGLKEDEPAATPSVFAKIGAWYNNLLKKNAQLDQVEKQEVDLLASVPLETYALKDNVMGILPIIMQGMDNNYSFGTQAVQFKRIDDYLILTWKEVEGIHQIPIGIHTAIDSTLNIRNEIFNISSFGELVFDEDDNLVLKATICFTETSSTRHIKFFFLPKEEIKINMDEDPSFTQIMIEAIDKMNLPDIIAKTMNDKSYTDYAIYQLSTPRVFGHIIHLNDNNDNNES